MKSKHDLERSLHEIRKLGDRLKESPAYEQFGYVTKSDLIDVYKSKRGSSRRGPTKFMSKIHSEERDSKFEDGNESSDDDILLMIQAPPGARIDVPQDQYNQQIANNADDNHLKIGQCSHAYGQQQSDYHLYITAPALPDGDSHGCKISESQQIHVKQINLSNSHDAQEPSEPEDDYHRMSA